jgi:hypothetical protein
LGKCDYAEACERLQRNGWNLHATLSQSSTLGNV